MLFFARNSSGVFRIHVHVTRKENDGSWGAPTAVSELNMEGCDTSRPNVSAAGRVIVFDSDRPGGLGSFDIWTAHPQTPTGTWSDPVNLGAAVNSEAGETRAARSRHGRRLYVGSSPAGGEGGSDLLVAERR